MSAVLHGADAGLVFFSWSDRKLLLLSQDTEELMMRNKISVNVNVFWCVCLQCSVFHPCLKALSGSLTRFLYEQEVGGLIHY